MLKIISIMILTSATSIFAKQLPENPVNHIVEAIEVLNEFEMRCKSDNDCTSVALGSKACGGPQGFIISSEKNSKMNQIETLAIMSEKLAKDYNRENNINSDCEYEIAPSVSCVRNRCIRSI